MIYVINIVRNWMIYTLLFLYSIIMVFKFGLHLSKISLITAKFPLFYVEEIHLLFGKKSNIHNCTKTTAWKKNCFLRFFFFKICLNSLLCVLMNAEDNFLILSWPNNYVGWSNRECLPHIIFIQYKLLTADILW